MSGGYNSRLFAVEERFESSHSAREARQCGSRW